MDIVRSLGEISLGSRLKRLSDMLMKEIQRLYKRQNVDFDPYLFPAFYNIVQHQNTTNNQLIEALKTSQPAVTQTINKLNQRGLISIRTDSIDKRKKIISASDKGEMLYKQLQPLWKILDETVKQYTTLEANTLVEHITHFEQALRSGDFMKTVNDRIASEINLAIINFRQELSRDFYELNIEWLETYFYVEDFDREVLSKPLKYIIEPGGFIFFAVENDKVLGTVALMPMKSGGYELTKMAVSPAARGKGIGQKLMQHCIDFARSKNWADLTLYSNRILENAIHIYRKYGFEEIPVEENSPYERSNIKMLLKLK